jgi:hypothetical protein
MLSAQQATTATSMARTLLLSIFDRSTLLNSNLKGGASRRPGTDEAIRLQKLDEKKLEAIYGNWISLKVCCEYYGQMPNQVFIVFCWPSLAT